MMIAHHGPNVHGQKKKILKLHYHQEGKKIDGSNLVYAEVVVISE